MCQAKTDHVDAHMLSELGARLGPEPTEPVAPARRALQARATRRHQLVEMRQGATRSHQTAGTEVRGDIRGVISPLDRRIERVAARMADLVAARPEMAAIGRRLRTTPGIGPIIGATLVAGLPEPGRLDRRRVAALAGPAPIAPDGGKREGRGSIGGGRPVMRGMLCPAAPHASRCEHSFGAAFGAPASPLSPPPHARSTPARGRRRLPPRGTVMSTVAGKAGAVRTSASQGFHRAVAKPVAELPAKATDIRDTQTPDPPAALRAIESSGPSRRQPTEVGRPMDASPVGRRGRLHGRRRSSDATLAPSPSRWAGPG